MRTARLSSAVLLIAGAVGLVGLTPTGYAAASGTDAPGSTLWIAHRFGPRLENTEGVGAVQDAVTPDGATVIVVGSKPSSPMVAYDTATGATKWATGRSAYVYALTFTPDGATLITLQDADSNGQIDDVMVAYDTASGAEKWAVHGALRPSALAVTPDGGTVIVTGSRGNMDRHTSAFATVAYDTGTGARKWVATYQGPAHLSGATALAITPDGATVVVTGGSYDEHWDDATIAYDIATGAQRWLVRYQGPGRIDDDVYAQAVAVTPDGATVVVTSNDDNYGRTHVTTIAYDATTGAQKWITFYQGPAHSATVDGLAITPDGTVVIAGSSYGKGKNDYATIAYTAATGALRWVARYDGPAHRNDAARALAITPDGATVIVTGSSHGEGTSGIRQADYATVAYDTATGARQWVARYHNPRHPYDQPRAVAITPDGATAIVTGQSRSDDSFGEWTTIAYRI